MKNKKLICAIIIAIGVIGVTGFIILGSLGGRNNTTPEPTSTAGTEVNIQNPPVTDEPTIPPATDIPADPTEPATPFDPDDPVGNGDIAPDEIPDENNDVKVINSGEAETGRIDDSETPDVTPEIKTEQSQKKQDETKPAEVENEIINDRELEKKEEAEKKKEQKAEKDDKPATVVSSDSTIGDEEDKPASVLDDTEEKSEDSNSNDNAPVFVNPAQGGENPFEGGNDSEIDDHNSDEFIGDDGDRPGEGIHF
jgi:hypothetical protein